MSRVFEKETADLCMGYVHALLQRHAAVGQQVRLELVPTDESRAFRPEHIELDIVFEDRDDGITIYNFRQ